MWLVNVRLEMQGCAVVQSEDGWALTMRAQHPQTRRSLANPADPPAAKGMYLEPNVWGPAALGLRSYARRGLSAVRARIPPPPASAKGG